MDENSKKNIRILIIIILVLVNVLVLVNNLIKEEKAKVSKNANSNENAIYNETNENIANIATSNSTTTPSISDSKISSMSESSRIKTYFGEFLNNIENENYSKAYSMLNADYKANYFPTLEEFETYVKENFPSGTLVVNYNSFDRKGEIYVINVSIYSLSGSKDNAVTEDVVIRENGTNDFTLSFSK